MNDIIIRIEAPELARAITNLAGALSVFGVALEEASPKKTTAQTLTGAAKSAAAVGETKETSAAAGVPAPPQHTIEEVRAAFSEYARAKGKDKAKELLLKYGAAKVTELKAENYDAAIRDIREV